MFSGEKFLAQRSVQLIGGYTMKEVVIEILHWRQYKYATIFHDA
jgi:hypothetical protein